MPRQCQKVYPTITINQYPLRLLSNKEFKKTTASVCETIKEEFESNLGGTVVSILASRYKFYDERRPLSYFKN